MEKINYEMYLDNLIALCHIIEDYAVFQARLSDVLSSKDDRNFVFQLHDVSKGKFVLGAHKAKKFYAENKAVIDEINQYSTIYMFISLNFWLHGEERVDIQYFYQYILEHINETDKILAVLERIKNLGFEKIEFNSELDFTQETHKIDTYFSDNFDIIYLNNLTTVPDYNPGIISYKTTGSPYKIKLGRFSLVDKKIFLNNLIFNPDELPSTLSRKGVFYKIIELKEERKKEYTSIKDSVKLGVSIADLYDMYNTVSSTIDKLESVQKKAELTELLLTIKEAILKMQTISTEYNQKVADENPTISEEFLEEQKKAYVRRRENSKLHID